MSQKRDVRPERAPLRRTGAVGAAALTDPALTPGLSVDGAPPLLAAGDDLVSLAVVRCWCREVLAVVWEADRTARGLPEPLLYVVAEIVEDPAVRPPAVREYRQRIRPSTSHPVSCPAHGDAVVAGSELLDAARRTASRLAAGEDAAPTAVRVSKSGRSRML